MKVCINQLRSSKNIAPVIFSKRLARELEKQKIKIVDRTQKHDILLAVVHDELINESKKKGSKIVQRLDGIYHYLDQDYNSMNKSIKKTYDESNSVIFQSEFSKKMIEKYFGDHRGNKFIIHNGVDENYFSKKRKNNKRIFLASAKWRPVKRLDSIVEGFKYADLNAELHILGEGAENKDGDKRIKYFGEVRNGEVPFYVNNSDFFIHLSYIESCPNSVVEALVGGLPVICTSNGGTSELVKGSGEIISEGEYNLEPYYSYCIPKVENKKVAQAINRLIINEKEYQFPRRDLFMSTCAENYIRVFEETLDKN